MPEQFIWSQALSFLYKNIYAVILVSNQFLGSQRLLFNSESWHYVPEQFSVSRGLQSSLRAVILVPKQFIWAQGPSFQSGSCYFHPITLILSPTPKDCHPTLGAVIQCSGPSFNTRAFHSEQSAWSQGPSLHYVSCHSHCRILMLHPRAVIPV